MGFGMARPGLAEGLDGIDACGPSSGQVRGDQRDHEQQQADPCEQKWIVRRQVEKLAGEQAVCREGRGQAKSQPDGDQPPRLAEHEREQP